MGECENSEADAYCPKSSNQAKHIGGLAMFNGNTSMYVLEGPQCVHDDAHCCSKVH